MRRCARVCTVPLFIVTTHSNRIKREYEHQKKMNKRTNRMKEAHQTQIYRAIYQPDYVLLLVLVLCWCFCFVEQQVDHRNVRFKPFSERTALVTTTRYFSIFLRFCSALHIYRVCGSYRRLNHITLCVLLTFKPKRDWNKSNVWLIIGISSVDLKRFSMCTFNGWTISMVQSVPIKNKNQNTSVRWLVKIKYNRLMCVLSYVFKLTVCRHQIECTHTKRDWIKQSTERVHLKNSNNNKNKLKYRPFLPRIRELSHILNCAAFYIN